MGLIGMVFKTHLIVVELRGPILGDGRYDLGETDRSRAKTLLQLEPLGLQEATGHGSTCRRAGNGLEHLHHLLSGQHCHMGKQAILEPGVLGPPQGSEQLHPLHKCLRGALQVDESLPAVLPVNILAGQDRSGINHLMAKVKSVINGNIARGEIQENLPL